jgi:WS/DGAT/MGAT family acyltransferase
MVALQMRQLTSLDAQFLALENPRQYGHVSGLTIYDPSTAEGGKLTLDALTALFEERIHLLPPFRWRLVQVPFGLDHPYWIDDPDFDLEYHVRELALPEPGDDRQLAEQVARIHARPLDRSRPLWETYLIQGLSGGRVAVLTKIHHAAIDGMSGAEIQTILLDLAPEGREVPPPPGRLHTDHKPGELEMLARGVASLPAQPVRMLGAVPSTVANLDALPGVSLIPGTGIVSSVTRRVAGLVGGNRDGDILEAPRGRPPRTVFNGRVSAHRRFSFGSLSLDEVKTVKNQFGVTVNDAVVSICAGAVRRYLLECNELPDEPLIAMIPVSVRTPEQFGTYGNKVSVMMVPIPTDEADPRKRLARAHETLKSAKGRHRAVPASILQDVTQFIPPAVLGRAARVTLGLTARRTPVFNLVISNVPGSPRPLYMAGAQMLAQYPVSAVADGLGLNITVISYLDAMNFGIVTDRDQVPDAWPMMDAVRDELATLVELIGGPTPRRPAAPKAAAAKQR